MESDGILLIDKDFGLTSSEAVQRVKKICLARKAGHTGTLDPYATGLLIITLGKATKISAYLGDHKKSYIAKVKLGEIRETYDRFGKLLDKNDVPQDRDKIENTLNEFLGKSIQKVPPHSAAHYEGKRLYEYARRGVKIPEIIKSIEITGLKILEYSWPFLGIKVECSTGTYIRSLAHELGQRLGCGGHLYSLRRTSVGHFSVEKAVSILRLEAIIRLELFGQYLIPIQKALEIPAILIDDPRSEKILHGRDVIKTDIMGLEKDFKKGDTIGIKNTSGILLAVGKALYSSGECRSGIEAGARIFEYKRVI